MNKRIYLVIIAMIIFVLYGNKVVSQIEYNNNQLDTTDIVIGKRYTIHSEVLGEDREIFIHVPFEERLDYDTVYYPVVYVFDGSSQFLSIVDIMNRLSNSLGDEICPKMIVVGIKQNDREKDLGLEHNNQEILTNNSLTNDKFTEFIEKELQPYVEANYNIIPYRILIGYSLGGLKAMNIIAYNTSLFNAYVIIDPSIGHYNNQWYNSSINKIEKADLSHKSVFLAMAQTMKMGTDTNNIKIDTTTDSRHMRDIMFAANAFRKNQSTYDFSWKYYPNEYHGSVPFIAEYDAFYKVFDWYNLQKIRFIFKLENDDDSVRNIISNHFSNISKKLGFNYSPPENYIKQITDYFYRKGKYKTVLSLLKFNCDNYPHSAYSKYFFDLGMNELYWNNKKSLNEFLSKNHFKKIHKHCIAESKKRDPEYNISEIAINTLGYNLIKEKKIKEALELFEINTELYPNSSNVFDSYGECLLLMGKEKEGLAAYKKSLELDPENTNAENVLKKYNYKYN